MKKRNAKRARSSGTPETSKRTVEIDFLEKFRAAVRSRPREQQREIGRAVDRVRDGFGAPHSHAGIGIRRLRRGFFECRVGLAMRLVFRAEKGVLLFHIIGSHDEVKRFLRTV